LVSNGAKYHIKPSNVWEEILDSAVDGHVLTLSKLKHNGFVCHSEI